VQIVGKNSVESHLSEWKGTHWTELWRHKWELSEFWCKWKTTYIHILNYIADIFTKQVYVEKIYLTFGLKPTMRKLGKDNGLEMLKISVLFSYRKSIVIAVLFEYLTVSLK